MTQRQVVPFERAWQNNVGSNPERHTLLAMGFTLREHADYPVGGDMWFYSCGDSIAIVYWTSGDGKTTTYLHNVTQETALTFRMGVDYYRQRNEDWDGHITEGEKATGTE